MALAAAGCADDPSQAGSSAATAPAEHLAGASCNGFIEASFRANPAFAVSQGRHEYDGQIADLEQTGLQNEVARLKNAIADAQAFDRRKLTREQRFERDYLIAGRQGPAVLDRRPPPTSRTPTRLIIWTTGSTRRSTSPCPMRRRNSG